MAPTAWTLFEYGHTNTYGIPPEMISVTANTIFVMGICSWRRLETFSTSL